MYFGVLLEGPFARQPYPEGGGSVGASARNTNMFISGSSDPTSSSPLVVSALVGRVVRRVVYTPHQEKSRRVTPTCQPNYMHRLADWGRAAGARVLAAARVACATLGCDVFGEPL